jgi:hypothetical protein
MDSKGNVVKEMPVNESQKIDFGFLEAGTYGYRLVDDRNNNRKWDTGNYLQHKQPEAVLYSTDKPNVRGAWELDTEWNLTTPKSSLRGK